jgi:hypothetical protein
MPILDHDHDHDPARPTALLPVTRVPPPRRDAALPREYGGW